MSFWTLVRRSVRFHALAHLGVVLGAVIGSAALGGALVVGDSVRESLRKQALSRIGNAWFALAPADRLFRAGLAKNTTADPSKRDPAPDHSRRAAGLEGCAPTATLLALPGTASRPGGEARANQVQIFAIHDGWDFVQLREYVNMPLGTVLLNETLGTQLGAHLGDQVIFRISKNQQLSGDSPIAPRDQQGIALTLKVAGILGSGSAGNLNLRATGLSPMNAFIRADELSMFPDFKGKANLLLVGHIGSSEPGTAEPIKVLTEVLQHSWTLEDAGLKLEPAQGGQGIELRSSRVFLEPQIVEAAAKVEPTNIGILTYLANLLVAPTNSTPYSMIAAAGAPYTREGMKDNEIEVNQWLASDLGVGIGETISFSYFDPESGAKLIERTNRFQVRSIVPMQLPWADQTLMPDFPGIEKAENPHDWDAGFPLVYKIRPKDEDYWKKYRGTPKAFITLAAGQKMWGNRFGNLTAIRFPNPPQVSSQSHILAFEEKLLRTLTPAQVGLQFEPVREQALSAANQSEDFGGLFLGFSIFLVVAALLLMALLFQFALEQRATEIGTFLALGFTGAQVRRLLLFEGATLALIGGVAGTIAGLGYARLMLLGLRTIWRNAIGASSLGFAVTPVSLVLGLAASTIVAWLTIWLTLRKQAQQPAHELLAGIARSPKSKRRYRAAWTALLTGLTAIGLIIWALMQHDAANAEIFFSAGSLLLVAGLAASAVWLNYLDRRASTTKLSMAVLAARNCARRRKRSITTMALLASGCFVICAIGAFRLDATRDASRPGSGTGGFALLGQSSLPVAQDLNTQSGREAFGLTDADLAGVRVVPMRVREGDEASCLNLNRAQRPRLLGVDPALLQGRFTFNKVQPGLDLREQWNLLKNRSTLQSDEVPAIGDANSIQWALGKKPGDTLDYVDESGRPLKIRLVGAVANSILQGNLLIDEAEFVKRFPSQSGYKMFLLDVPRNRVSEVSGSLSRALQDRGLELTSTVKRLDAFNAVQNTYLGTFQVLGGLGLLLGSAGLGIVVLRNVLERRGELGLLLATGFRGAQVQNLVLTEHGTLLGLGLAIGLIAAVAAILPALFTPGAHLPYFSLAITLCAVLMNGVFWTWAATSWAVRGDLLAALRNE